MPANQNKKNKALLMKFLSTFFLWSLRQWGTNNGYKKRGWKLDYSPAWSGVIHHHWEASLLLMGLKLKRPLKFPRSFVSSILNLPLWLFILDVILATFFDPTNSVKEYVHISRAGCPKLKERLYQSSQKIIFSMMVALFTFDLPSGQTSFHNFLIAWYTKE